MWVLVVMFAGIGIGLGVRKISFFAKNIDTAVMWTIYLLLFLLGLSIGNNDEVINNMGSIGWQALVIAIGAVIGSAVLVSVFGKLIHRKQKNTLNQRSK